MASTAILAIRIISDARNAAKDLKGIETGASRMQGALNKAAPAAKATVLGLAAVGAAAFSQASKLQQSSGAVESVFKGQADAVKRLAGDAANNVGLATSEYQELAAVLGAQLGNLGVAQKDLVPVTDDLISKASDLAATFGGSTQEAVEALSAAFRGETDPIEKYGISIKQASVDALLAKQGLDGLTGAAETQARTAAMMTLIQQQSTAATGAFAREADTAAGAQARATASLKDAGAEIGTVLLPIVAALATKLAGAAKWAQNNSGAITVLAAVAGGLAATVLTVNAALSAYRAVSMAVRAAIIVFRNAQLALNLAMMMNPIGLIIVAVVALVAAIVIAYKKSETFRSIVQAVGRAAATAFGWVVDKVKDVIGWVKDKAPAAFQWLKDKATGFINAMIAPIQKVIGWISDLINKIQSIDFPDLPGFGGGGFGLGGLFGSAHSPALAAGAGAGLTASAGGPAFGGRGGVVINVTGALDPDAVARQIETLLERRNRRLGRR